MCIYIYIFDFLWLKPFWLKLACSLYISLFLFVHFLELMVSVEQLWEEDYDSALVDDGWSDDGTSTEIQCEISLKECDERGFVLAEFDGH